MKIYRKDKREMLSELWLLSCVGFHSFNKKVEFYLKSFTREVCAKRRKKNRRFYWIEKQNRKQVAGFLCIWEILKAYVHVCGSLCLLLALKRVKTFRCKVNIAQFVDDDRWELAGAALSAPYWINSSEDIACVNENFPLRFSRKHLIYYNSNICGELQRILILYKQASNRMLSKWKCLFMWKVRTRYVNMWPPVIY